MTRTGDRRTLRAVRALHWFRSDLRLLDNLALADAAARADALACVFVFDDRLLRSSRVGPPRLRFLRDCVVRLGGSLAARGHALVVRRGDPVGELVRLARESRADLVSWNRDYGPYARRRDTRARAALADVGVEVLEAKDRVLFEGGEVRTRSGGAFRVFTPFRRAWLARLREEGVARARPLRLPDPIGGLDPGRVPDPAEIGAATAAALELPTAGEEAARRRLDRFLDGSLAAYGRRRNLVGPDDAAADLIGQHRLGRTRGPMRRR